jgi:hypothetical protein
MQTVQFQCGSCGKMMAVGVEHLGAQVHCPHCMAIVQAPSGAQAPPAPTSGTATPSEEPIPEIHVRSPEVEEGSIFGVNTEDDLFTARGPEVEMPAAPVAAPTPAPPHFETGPPELLPAVSNPTPAPDPDVAAGEAATEAFSPDQHWTDAAALADESALPPQDLSRYKQSRSMLVPMLLIFLIPYSVVCTGYIIWTLINPPGSSFDPLELLRDPKPGELHRRVPPEVPLPRKLKTTLNQPIQVGDTEVTPLKVVLVNQDLVLYLKMRNRSRDLAYNPLPDPFLRYTEKLRPYTFLDTGKEKLFGGYVEYRKNGKEDKRGIIEPGEENLTLLTTNDKHREQIAALPKSPEEFVWRVQVRRGFVSVRGKEVSATAVIGVVFSRQNIEKGAAEARSPKLLNKMDS